MNCIFVCAFNHPKYVDMLFLLLESILIYGGLDEHTNVLIYTSTPFMHKIKQSHLYNENIEFEINDSYDSIDSACKSRLDVFELQSISKYSKILYLDTDILVTRSINKVFDICQKEKLYALEEGTIDCQTDYWGKSLFGDLITNYSDKSAFSSGILLFKNCSPIRDLFCKIKEDIRTRPASFHDQPHIVYNAFIYNLYDNQVLKSYAINNAYDIQEFNDKVIYHYPGGPGIYEHKIKIMNEVLNRLKDYTITNNIHASKQYINEHLLPIIRDCNEPLEGNIFMFHHTTTYTDLFLNKAKNISNMVLHSHVKNVMEIGFNAGFSALLMLITNPNIQLTCFDLGEHSYTYPCYLKLKETFGSRISLIQGDSTKTLIGETNKYDVIHIDGGHSTAVAESDILNSYRLTNPGCILIMDDYDFPNLHELWDFYVELYKLSPLNISTYTSPHHDIKFVPRYLPNVFENYLTK